MIFLVVKLCMFFYLGTLIFCVVLFQNIHFFLLGSLYIFNATVAFVANFIFMDVSPLGLLCVTDVFLQFYFAIPLALLQILRNRNF